MEPTDESLMEHALAEAKTALEHDDVPHEFVVTMRVLEHECAQLLTDFFQVRR